MHLGISIDKVQLKATVLDEQLNTVYSSQQSLSQTALEIKQQVFQLVDNFQWNTRRRVSKISSNFSST